MDSMIKSYNTGTNMEVLQQTYITEDKFIPPLTKILEEITPNAHKDSAPPRDISASLDTLFPEQQRQDKDLQKTKQILGDLAKGFTESELKDLIAEVQFLVESWLDDFERDVFSGKTLKELLHERSGI